MKQLKYVLAMMLAVALLGAAAISVAAQEDAPPRREHRPRGVAGEVTATGDSSLTITAVTREEETVEIVVNMSDETIIILMETQTEGSLNNIEVGDHVRVDGPRNEDGSVDARHVVVAPDGERMGGRVTAVDGQTISVKNREGEATIVANANTIFWIGREEQGSLADVTAGKSVEAFGELQDDGSLSASVVFVRERPPHGPGGPGGPRPGARDQGECRPDIAGK